MIAVWSTYKFNQVTAKPKAPTKIRQVPLWFFEKYSQRV